MCRTIRRSRDLVPIQLSRDSGERLSFAALTHDAFRHLWIELARASELDALGPCAGKSGPHPFLDPGPLEFGQRGQDMELELPGRWRWIARQRDELVMVQVGQLHPSGAPIGLGLLDPLLAR